jgi:hypothetical protein
MHGDLYEKNKMEHGMRRHKEASESGELCKVCVVLEPERIQDQEGGRRKRKNAAGETGPEVTGGKRVDPGKGRAQRRKRNR